MGSPLRWDASNRFKGAIVTHGVRPRLKAGILHWGVGTADIDATDIQRVENLIEVNRSRQTGYPIVIAGAVAYILASWRSIVWHAGGPRATIESPNTDTVGVCIAYIGPSQLPRGIPGEVLGPHHKLGQAWYPPIPRGDVLLAALAMRRLRQYGLKQVWGHSEVNAHPDGSPAKSDPFPVDMDEFRSLVLDDDHWEAAVAAHQREQ
jgi:hypothetical protein